MDDRSKEGFIKLLCHVNISPESVVLNALEEALQEYKLISSDENRKQLQMAQTAVSLKLMLNDVSFDTLLNDMIKGTGGNIAGTGAYTFRPN